jgi:hypothetical protein
MPTHLHVVQPRVRSVPVHPVLYTHTHVSNSPTRSPERLGALGVGECNTYHGCVCPHHHTHGYNTVLGAFAACLASEHSHCKRPRADHPCWFDSISACEPVARLCVQTWRPGRQTAAYGSCTPAPWHRKLRLPCICSTRLPLFWCPAFRHHTLCHNNNNITWPTACQTDRLEHRTALLMRQYAYA